MQRVGRCSAKERDRLDITRYSISWFFGLRCMYLFKYLSQEVAEKPWLSFLNFSGEAFPFKGVPGIWDMTVLCKTFNILGLCSSNVSSVASPPPAPTSYRTTQTPLHNTRYLSKKGSSAPHNNHCPSGYSWTGQNWSSWILPPASYQVNSLPS